MNCRTRSSPSPSMSIAPRPAKCTMRCTRCIGQSTLMQWWFASPSRRTSGSPHSGHCDGNFQRRAPFASLREDRTDDLGDDVAGAPDDDRVALAHVLARDVVLVVQRGERDVGAADEDGLEHRERGRPSGPPDADHDVAQDRGLLFRRELVGDRPARRARRRSPSPPAGRGRRPSRRHRRCRSRARGASPPCRSQNANTASSSSNASMFGLTGKPSSRQPVERLGVRAQPRPALERTGLVAEHGQVARRGDARVLLAQAARGGVAGVDEEPLPRLALAPVQLLERRERHEHLAAHLEQCPARACPSAVSGWRRSCAGSR